MYDVELSFTRQTDGTVGQDITTTAASTNIIDLGNSGNFFRPAYLHVRVTAAFTASTAATMAIDLQSDSTSAFSSEATLQPVIADTGYATFEEGYHLVVPLHLQNMEQFLRLYFTVSTGPMTAGTVVAYINDSPEL